MSTRRRSVLLRPISVAVSDVANRAYSTALTRLAATVTERALSQEADPARRAGLLNKLANRLSDLGRREEALGAAEEALDLRRTLAAANPQAFTPDLAMSLGKLYGTRMEAGL